MTIGPAPMIRIDLMSVRFGILSKMSLSLLSGEREKRAQKKGALGARPSDRAEVGPRARGCFRPESAGMEGPRTGQSPTKRWTAQKYSTAISLNHKPRIPRSRRPAGGRGPAARQCFTVPLPSGRSCRRLPREKKPGDAVEDEIEAEQEAKEPQPGHRPAAKNDEASQNSEDARQHHDPVGAVPEADSHAQRAGDN